MPLPFIDKTKEYAHGVFIKVATKPQNVPKNQLFSWAGAYRNQPACVKFWKTWAAGLVDIFTPGW